METRALQQPHRQAAETGVIIDDEDLAATALIIAIAASRGR
jgi:hypothetical protein